VSEGAWLVVDSPLGLVGLHGRDGAVVRVLLPHELDDVPAAPGVAPAFLRAAGAQLVELLAGRRRGVEVAVRTQGTAFQEATWAAIEQIPYGTTATYGQLAAAIGRPGAARAVGAACGANPVPLLRPCHRVVAAHGLGGFSGDLELKAALLELERA
jgi:methylated-DNA-[protein]-cysteine S-methyltransferase